jgi:AcrR family transcriptional regulator
MATLQRATAPSNRSRETTFLSRSDWISAALASLEEKGIANVKVEHLAKKLKVTRGSFYFHFENRKELLSSLLEEWRKKNCLPFETMAAGAIEDGRQFVVDVTNLWLPNGTFNPKLDMAVRDWARSSREVRKEIKRADEIRMDLFHQALKSMGFPDDEALIRARIAYLHQIGYYAVGFVEPLERRLKLVPLYLKAIMGAEVGELWETRGNVSARDRSAARRRSAIHRSG